eukprot:s6824_g1.t1
MQGLLQWLEAPETCDSDQSTVDVAWSLLRRAWRHRKDGNDLLSEKPGAAREQYSLGLSCVAKAAGLAALEGLQTTEPFEYRDFLNASKLVEGALHRNLSLLAQQQGDCEASVRHADASLKAEPGHLKSIYRRAAALLHLRRYGEAEADLQEILAQDPRNSDARRLLRRARDRAPSPPSRPSAMSKIDSEVLPTPLLVPDAQPTCDCPVCQLWKESMSAGEKAVEFLRTSANKVSVLLARRDAQGRTALHLAVMAPEDRASDPPATLSAGRCQGLVETLLEKGAEVELRDVDERTPLHLAARDGRTQAVSLLLDAGSEVDALDRFGRTPLYYAAQGSHRDVVALLVDRGHADQSILFHALKEKFGTHNFVLQDWPEYNGRWMSSKEGRRPDLPLRTCEASETASQLQGVKVAKDIQSFRWDWLKQMMGREAQMCQLFCGVEGFSPCHYDPQDGLCHLFSTSSCEAAAMPRGLAVALRDWDTTSPQEPVETHLGVDFPLPLSSSRRRDIAVEFLSSSQSSAGWFLGVMGC